LSRAFKGRPILIQEKHLSYIFGFRAKTAVDAAKKMKFISPQYYGIIHTMDNAWKDIVQIAKSKIALLDPDVIIGNHLSNVAALGMDEIPMEYSVKKSMEAINGMRSWRRLNEEVNQIQTDIRVGNLTGDGLRKAHQRLIYLNREIKANPVNEAIEAGLFSTIVDEVEARDVEATKDQSTDHGNPESKELSESCGRPSAVQYPVYAR